MGRTYNDTMFIDTFEHEYTWLNGFLRNVSKYSNKTAIIDPEQNKAWTYSELNQESNKLANALLKAGIKKNDVVMIILKNSPTFCFSYIGARKAGSILMPVNYKLAYGELALLIDHNKPSAIIYCASQKDNVINAEKICTWKCSNYIMADNMEDVPLQENHISYESFVKDESTENPALSFRPHIYDEVLRLCTSGTTALAKSVPINDINEVLSAHDVIMQCSLTRNDITLNMTPWFHRGGIHSGGLCPTFYLGATLVLMRKFSPQNILDYIQEYKITLLSGVPSNLDLLCHAQSIKKRNLCSLKGIVTMGSPLTKDACLRYAKALTPNIYNGYGTTETFWNSLLMPCDIPQKAGTIGNCCIDDEVRIVHLQNSSFFSDPDNMVPKDGVTKGEIITRSPSKTTYSYYNDDENQSKKFHKGWTYTGDIGTWDKDCFISIIGRKDNMLIISGENVYPEQIEEELCKCPSIKDCIITSIPDHARGQSIVIYIVPKESLSQFNINDVKAFFDNSPLISKYKTPRYYTIVESLTYNETGKKSHSLIKKRVMEDFNSGLLQRL